MSKAILVSIVSTLAVVALCIWLNPSPEQHREEIMKAVADRRPLAGLLGLGVLTAFTSTYHPLGVASYTTADDHVVSIGVLGMVFVMDPSPDQ